MKFGLYVMAGTSSVFRCINGEWTAIPNITRYYSTPEKGWEAVSTMPGKPVDAKYIASRTHLNLLTSSRSMARVIYGVPDDVELYAPGERPSA